jgi:membrane protein
MAFRSEFSKKIVSSPQGKYIITGSKKIYLPGFNGFSIYDVAPPFYKQLRKTSLPERASGISFNVVMAIPPTLIFLFTLIPLLPISESLIEELFTLTRDLVPGPENNAVILGFLQDFLERPRNELLSFGLLLAIFFSSNAIMGILRAFDKNYPGFSRRKGWQKRMVALKLTFIFFILILVFLSLLIAQGRVLGWLGLENQVLINIIQYVRWLLIILLMFYIVSFIYRHGPSVAKKWPFLTPGAILATTMMIVSTALVSFWVNNFANYNKIYGSIGAILILMSLVYVNALAILMGFELNVTLSNLRAAKAEREEINT